MGWRVQLKQSMKKKNLNLASFEIHWTYSVTFATDIERGNVTFKDLSNRESGSRFPMKNCSLRSRFFFFFNNCSTIFHWETAPRFAVRKIFERDIATFNVAGKSN